MFSHYRRAGCPQKVNCPKGKRGHPGVRATQGSGCSPNRRTERTEVCEDEAAAPLIGSNPQGERNLRASAPERSAYLEYTPQGCGTEPPRRAEGGIRGELVPARKARSRRHGHSAECPRALAPLIGSIPRGASHSAPGQARCAAPAQGGSTTSAHFPSRRNGPAESG